MRHGDCRHGGGSDGARAGSRDQAEHPLRRDRPEAEPRPCGTRAMPPGRLRSRSRASPTLCRRLLGVLAGGYGVERGAGAPGGADPPQAVGDPCRARWRHSFRRPKGPKVSVLASSSHLHGQLSDPLHGAIQFRLHRIALALLERGVDPADRFLTPLLEPEDLYAQLARQKLHRLVTQKPQNDLTLARHRPSLAKSGPAGKAWPGENVDEPSSPAFTTGPSTQLSSQNYRSCSGPPWTLRLSQFCVQENRVRLTNSSQYCELKST